MTSSATLPRLILTAAERSGVDVPGSVFGTDVTVLVVESEGSGKGPCLHVHPYGELFVVHQGRARYEVGDESVEAGAGDVLFAPAGVPHRFVTLSEGPFRATDIHLSPEWIQTNLS